MIRTKQTKVLIADENSSVINTLRLTLAPQGMEILQAHQALDALELFNDKLPEIVFLDAMIEGEIDGITLCQLIKSMKLPHDCVVILLFAQASEENSETSFAAGADDYLVKPFNEADVLNAIAACNQKLQHRTASPDTLKVKSIPTQETHFLPVPYESLTGFDEAGLRNLEFMLGSKEKVFDTLKNFIIDFEGIIDEIRASFHSQQKEVARRKLHSLKGTAAIVGANTLSTLAADIEAQVFLSENIDAQLSNLQEIWQTVNHTVSTMF